MEYPLRSRLITSLYSAFICSAVFTEPTLRPSFPPFSIYHFRPDCNRNEILSRSNCAQAPSNGFPSSFVPFYFLSFLMLTFSFIADCQVFNLRYKGNMTRGKNETKVGKQSANLGKNNEPIPNRHSSLIYCKSVLLHPFTILSFPMVRPAWDNCSTRQGNKCMALAKTVLPNVQMGHQGVCFANSCQTRIPRNWRLASWAVGHLAAELFGILE